MSHTDIIVLGTGLAFALIAWFVGRGSIWSLLKGFALGIFVAFVAAGCVSHVDGVKKEKIALDRQAKEVADAEIRRLEEAEISSKDYDHLIEWKNVDCTVDRLIAEALVDDRVSPAELETIDMAGDEYNLRYQKSKLRGEKAGYCPKGKAA